MTTAAVAIATSLDGTFHILGLLAEHVRACEAFRMESTPADPRMLVPTERSIVAQIGYVRDVHSAAILADPSLTDRFEAVVGPLFEDLSVGNERKSWTSSFDDVAVILATTLSS